MVWRLKTTTVATEIRKTSPGDVFCILEGGAKGQVWIRLNDHEGDYCFMRVTGGLTFFSFRPHGTVNVLVIADRTRLRIEIAGDRPCAASQGAAGELFFNQNEAMMRVKDHDGIEVDVSLTNWSVAGTASVGAAFNTWRLVDFVAQEERRTIFAVGDWTKVNESV
jgi:hypothetical protein